MPRNSRIAAAISSRVSPKRLRQRADQPALNDGQDRADVKEHEADLARAPIERFARPQREGALQRGERAGDDEADHDQPQQHRPVADDAAREREAARRRGA